MKIEAGFEGRQTKGTEKVDDGAGGRRAGGARSWRMMSKASGKEEREERRIESKGPQARESNAK